MASTASLALLSHLYQAGNLDRLEKECRRVLDENPEDPFAHAYLVDAFIDQHRLKAAQPHVEFLLRNDPNTEIAQLAAARWHLASGRWKQARNHAAAGLSLNPDSVRSHYFAALAASSGLKMREAQRHIDRARELDPDDPHIADLALRIQGTRKTSATDAWSRIAEYYGALQRDPENAALHAGIAIVFLEDLDRPQDAESHYREALRIEPRRRAYQRYLFDAVAQRSLFYRTLSLPSRTFTYLRNAVSLIARQPWRLLILFLLFKFVGIFFLWLTAATMVLWPAAKIYEWLLVSEIRSAASSNLNLRLRHRFHRWPRPIRFLLFGMLIAIAWGVLLNALSLPLTAGFIAIAIFFAIHFATVSTLAGLHRLAPRSENGAPSGIRSECS